MNLRDNTSIVRDYIDTVINHREYSRINEFLSMSFTGGNHLPHVNARDAYIDHLKKLSRTSSDCRFEVHGMTLEDDKVIVTGRWTGTHDGHALGIPATRKTFSFDAIQEYSLLNGAVTAIDGTVDIDLFYTQIQNTYRRM